MDEFEGRSLLDESGAVRRHGHFVYRSWRHGSTYVDKDELFRHPRTMRAFGAGLASLFRDTDIDAVVGPAVGGISVCIWTAESLSLPNAEVLSVIADRRDSVVYTAGVDDPAPAFVAGTSVNYEPGDSILHRKPGFVIKRGGQTAIVGKRVLAVDDVVHEGGSMRGTIQAIRDAGGIVVGAGCIVHRGSQSAATLGVPCFRSLVSMRTQSYPEDACPYCTPGPLLRIVDTDLGYGAAFLARQKRGAVRREFAGV